MDSLRDFLGYKTRIDIIGVMKPIAADGCIVNPHKSKDMVAMLTSIVLQKPHFLLVKRLKAAISPKTPKDRNIMKSVREVRWEIGTSRNCPIPMGVPSTAKKILPMDWRIHRKPTKMIFLSILPEFFFSRNTPLTPLKMDRYIPPKISALRNLAFYNRPFNPPNFYR